MRVTSDGLRSKGQQLDSGPALGVLTEIRPHRQRLMVSNYARFEDWVRTSENDPMQSVAVLQSGRSTGSRKRTLNGLVLTCAASDYCAPPEANPTPRDAIAVQRCGRVC